MISRQELEKPPSAASHLWTGQRPNPGGLSEPGLAPSLKKSPKEPHRGLRCLVRAVLARGRGHWEMLVDIGRLAPVL